MTPVPPDSEPRGPEAAGEPEEAGSKDFTLRTLLAHSWIYSLVPLVQRIAGIVLIPIYTAPSRIGPDKWAVLELSELVILLVPQLVGANLLGGMARFYFEQKDEVNRRRLVASTVLALSVASWLVTGLALLFREPCARLVFGTAGETPSAELLEATVLTLLIVPFSLTARVGVDYFVILRRPGLVATIRIVKTFVVIGLNIVLIVFLEQGALGYLRGILVGEVLSTVLVTGFVVAKTGVAFSWPIFRPMLAYALPLLPMGLVQIGLHQFDRFLLKELAPAGLGREWVGIYGMGYKIGFLVHVAVLGSFMQVWQPWIFDMKEEQRREGLVRVGTYALAALSACYLGAAIYGRQCVLLLAGQESYYAAYRVSPLACASYLLYATYSLNQVSLFVAKRTWPLLWINVVALAVNIVLNLWLIPIHGFVGAAWATLGSFAVLAVGGGIAAGRLYRMSFELRRAAIVALLGAASVAAAAEIDAREVAGVLSPVAAIGTKFALLLAVLGVLWGVVIDAEGRAGIARLVRERTGRALPGPPKGD